MRLAAALAAIALFSWSLRASAQSDAPPPPDPAPAIALFAVGGALVAGGAVTLGFGVAEHLRVVQAPEGALWADYAGSNDVATALFAAGPIAMLVGTSLLAVGVATLSTGRTSITIRAGAAHLALEARF